MIEPGRKFNSASAYRYGFNTQEKSIEIDTFGNLNTAQFWEYDTRIGRRWNRDPKSNGSLSDYATFLNDPLWHIDFKGDTPTIKEAAVIASNVNEGINLKELTAAGFKRVDPRINKVVYNDLSGLNSGLYERKKANGKMEYVYATSGTEEPKDGEADALEFIGLSRQYQLSAGNAVAIRNYLGKDADLTFVGHSLGGGLAATNAMVTNGYAITFNPATVHAPTMFLNGLDPSKGVIDNYIVKGEALTSIRIFSLGLYGPPIGKNHYLIPDKSDITLFNPISTAINLHLIGPVIRAIDNSQKPPVTNSNGNIFTQMYNSMIQGINNTEKSLQNIGPH